MNAILSFFVCIAMLLSPTGVLPVQPETASTWTISNLTIAVGDESVTLAPEARITGAAGAEEVQLHFEVGSGENTLMPMSGAINADGVRFTLGTGTKTYTLNEETFMELTGMDEEDARMLGVFGDFFLSYGKVLNLVKDQEKYAQFYDLSWGLMEDMLGAEFVETEVEVEGEMLPGLQINGGLTIGGMLNMLDVVGECGIPEMEEFVDATLELVNAASGETIEKFSDLAEMIEAEEELEGVIMEMDCSYVTGDPMYSKVDMTMDVEGQSMTAQAESITRGENTVAMMVMDMNVEDTAMSYAITMDYTGPINAPTRMDVTYDIRNESDYSYEYTDDDGSVVSYYSVDNTAMRAVMNAEVVDGLKNIDAEFIVDNTSTYGYSEDDMESYGEAINMNMAYNERLEENGSITGSVALGVNVDDETVGISFDVNRAEGEIVDYFANTTEQPLTADTEDAGYSALMADFMGVAADAMALTADDSVMELVAMFEAMEGGVDVYEEDYDEDYEEVTEDKASVVASLEEAAAIFDGTVPAYTAPEGYSLQEVEVDEYSLYATYASADDEFELCIYSYSADDNPYYSMAEDGTLTPIEGLVVEMSMYGDEVGSATVNGNGSEVVFYFSGVDMATAQAIVAGLI